MQNSSNPFLRINELLEFLELKDVPGIDFSSDFPMRVPYSYAKKMQKGNPNDPLLRQVLPTLQENIQSEGFLKDPVGDTLAQKENGILQKYKHRILLIAGNTCSVRCRFCFRRNSKLLMPANLSILLQEYLEKDFSIKEIIFSGGDPFMTPISVIEELIKKAIPAKAVRTLRFHTRVPITEPELAKTYLPLFEKYSERFHFILVLHANHAQEISNETTLLLKQFKNANVLLLNQSTLLKGVNDSAETLAELSHTLFENGVLPYYLHLLDKAQGTAHFEVNEQDAKKIYHKLLTLLPGYLVPKMVRENQGEKSKTPVF